MTWQSPQRPSQPPQQHAPQQTKPTDPFPLWGVFLAIGTTVAILAVILVFLVSFVFSAPSTTSAPSADAALRSRPTSTSAPTDTPAPPLVTTATLGGPWSAFERAYGPQLNGQRNTWAANIAGQGVQILVTPAHSEDARDGGNRAFAVQLAPLDPSTYWSANQAAAIVAVFLPPDAHHTTDGSSSGGVPYHGFVSALLANTFRASAFTNDAGTSTAAPGSLLWHCTPAQTNGQVADCSIETGSYR